MINGNLQRGHASPRGSSLGPHSVTSSTCVLQRGHASPRGSSTRRPSICSRSRTFNGATRHRVDRGGDGRDRCRTLGVPSTGPRVTAWIEKVSAWADQSGNGLQRGHASPRGSRAQPEVPNRNLLPSTGPRVTAWIEYPPLTCRGVLDTLQRGHASPRGSSPVSADDTEHARRPSTGPRVTAWIENTGPLLIRRGPDRLQRGHASPRGSSRTRP